MYDNLFEVSIMCLFCKKKKSRSSLAIGNTTTIGTTIYPIRIVTNQVDSIPHKAIVIDGKTSNTIRYVFIKDKKVNLDDVNKKDDRIYDERIGDDNMMRKIELIPHDRNKNRGEIQENVSSSSNKSNIQHRFANNPMIEIDSNNKRLSIIDDRSISNRLKFSPSLISPSNDHKNDHKPNKKRILSENQDFNDHNKMNVMNKVSIVSSNKTTGLNLLKRKDTIEFQNNSRLKKVDTFENIDKDSMNESIRKLNKKKSEKAREKWKKGFRTLKYANILMYEQNNNRESNIDSNNMLDINKLQEKKLNSQASFVIEDKDDINQIERKDFSHMDLSICPNNRSSARRASRVSVQSKVNNERKQSPNRQINRTILNVEVRENKDLNTTYIRENKMIGPKGAPKDLGFSVNGKRMKINEYILVKMIGQGGWGEVFMGVHELSKIRYVG